MIVKNFAFRFVNGYASLFYLAFVKAPNPLFGTSSNPTDVCIGAYPGISWRDNAMLCKQEVMSQLLSLLLVKTVWGNFSELILPQVTLPCASFIFSTALFALSRLN